MNWQLLMGSITAALAAMSPGCDDEAPAGNGGDTGMDVAQDSVTETGDVQNDTTVTPPACYTQRAGTSYQPEATGADAEHSDCISGCDHGLPVFLINLEQFNGDGLRGVIDGSAHRYGQQGVDAGPDLDLIGITGEPRTLVEVIVEPFADESLVDPVVTGHDGFFPVTFSSDMAPGFRPARIVFALPYLEGLPFYVAIEHAHNYENFGQPGAVYEGGQGFDYVMRVTELPFEPNDLGTLGPDNATATVASATFSCPGDIHYYRFLAPTGMQPTVNFQRTGNEALLGVLAGFNTVGGQLKWDAIFDDARVEPVGDGQVTLPASAFEACADCVGAGMSEFIFSVTEWNGAGGEDYTYSLEVTVQ